MGPAVTQVEAECNCVKRARTSLHYPEIVAATGDRHKSGIGLDWMAISWPNFI